MARSLLFLSLALSLACACSQAPKKPAQAPAPKERSNRELLRGKVQYIDAIMDPDDASITVIRIMACGKPAALYVPSQAFQIVPEKVEQFVDDNIAKLCGMGI